MILAIISVVTVVLLVAIALAVGLKVASRIRMFSGAAVFLLLAIGAFAQTNVHTTVTASNINDGVNPITGRLCVVPVATGTNTPAGYRLYGGGQIDANPANPPCVLITAGALPSVFQVPDMMTVAPNPGTLAFQVYDSSFHLIRIDYVQPTGMTWSYDNFVPSTTLTVPAGSTFISGTGAPSGACTAPSIYYRQDGGTQYECVASVWTALGGSGSGTVSAGTGGQIAGYASSGTIVGGITLGTGLSITGSTLNAASSGGTWGSITGTLSSQTDLATALAAKAPLGSPTFTGAVTIPNGGLSGLINCSNLPADTSGDVTRSAGTCADSVVGLNGANLATTFGSGRAVGCFTSAGVPTPCAANSDYVAPVAQTISALTYTPTDTTIVASWYTSKASDSHLSCTGKLAVDDGIDSPSYFHQNIVTGLTAATAYSCFVASGATSSSASTVTTNAAATRTAITSITFGTPTSTTGTGDTNYNCVSNDGKTYVTEDDGSGFGTTLGSVNMQIDVWTAPATLTGSSLNILTNYGGLASSNGTDGPGGSAMSNKLSGIFCMGGSLYAFQTRGKYGSTSASQLQWYGNIMKSTDHGVTWNTWQNPTGASASGIPPNPLGSYMFGAGSAAVNTTASTTSGSAVIVVTSAAGIVAGQSVYGTGIAAGSYVASLAGTSITLSANATATGSGVAVNFGGAIGWVTPVIYANDDGTTGYLNAGNAIDGANAFVYMTYTGGKWNNDSNLYLARIPRKQLEKQDPGAMQYWIGPSSPTSANFVTDSNWVSSNTSATAIYSASSQVSAPSLVYVPTYNEYLLFEWYQPSLGVASNTTWVISSAPTPAGPWTQIATQSNSPQGWYNEIPVSSSVAATAGQSNSILELVFTGDYNTQTNGYYKPNYESIVLNPLPVVDAIGGTAIFAGSFAKQVKASYSGALINVERASDSTTSDIGQTSGVLNTSALATFCSGTTCGVHTLYDQSGNGNNLTQATYASMCVIYTGGAVVTNGVNGRPACYWNSTGQYLSAAISLSGTSFESIGVGTINSGAVAYAGMGTLTDGTHSGGNSGNVGLLARDNTSQAIDTIAGGACGITYVNLPAYGTQFEWDSYDTLTSGQSCGVSVNGGTYSVTTATGSPTLVATTLLMGADEPPSTYYLTGYMSELVLVGGSYLTSAQRAAAHAAETFFYGTP